VYEDVLPAVKSAKQAGMIVYGVYDKYSAHHQGEIRALADGYLLDFQNAPLPCGEVCHGGIVDTSMLTKKTFHSKECKIGNS
jgi:hypothetical protein